MVIMPDYQIPSSGKMTIPIFPLEGVLLLPDGDLPLNIFEPRYLAMVKTAMAGDRLIGMIQPTKCVDKMPEALRPFYRVGCIGRISIFEETKDGRYLINLRGVTRFELLSHDLHQDGYRLAEVDCASYHNDFLEPEPLPECLTRHCFIEKLQTYLSKEGLYLDWSVANDVPDARFFNLIAMVCPFSPAEKQALLESQTFEDRCRLLKSLLDISCAEATQQLQERPC